MRNSHLLMTLAFGLALTACAEDGKDGADGTNGADGATGEDGTNGVDGVDGENGADGLCADATPVEITGIAGMTGETEYVGFESGTMTVESNAAGSLSYTVAGYGFDYAWDGDDFTVTATSDSPSSQVIIATDGCTTATYEFELDAEWGISYVNLVHLYEGAPSVDVGFSGEAAEDAFLEGFEFESNTGYYGFYSTPAVAFDLFVEGAVASTTPELALMPNGVYTVVVYPDTGAVAYAVLEDDISETSAEDQVRVTAMHGADGVGQVDVWETLSSTALFSDLDFGTSDTLEVTAGPAGIGIDVDDDATVDFEYAADLTDLAGYPLSAIVYMNAGEPSIYVSAPMAEYSAILSLACDAAAGTECLSEPGSYITNGVTVTDVISTRGACTIASIEMSVDIDHTWISDITATLTAPDGTAVEVMANSGGSRDFIVGTFASDGTGYAEMGYSTSTTSTEYTQPDMTPFVGGAAAGDWSLVLDDVYGGDDGTLNSWGLTFTCE